MLITTFEAKPFPEKVEIRQLAGLLNISKEKVDHWFRKKRCEERQVGSKPMGKSSSIKYINSADTGDLLSVLI